MDETLLELLHKVTVVDLLIALAVIGIVGGVLLTQKKRISKALNKWRKTKNEEDALKESVIELKGVVEALSATVGEYQQNRIHDREDSRRIQREIYDAISEQAESINSLKQITLEIEEKNAKTKRAEIKEKIARIYEECSPNKTCTDMAKETLRDLIEEYEEHGGKNSFVHSTVEPEMSSWTVISTIKHDNH